MGCAPSCGPSVGVSQLETDQFAPPPPIPVTVGNGVRRTPVNDKAVLFIFGGPGSQKGMILEELSARFDFMAITIEDIIFNYLPNKVSNSVEKPSEIMHLLKRDTGVLSLDWILSMISAKLSSSYSQRFVIDIVPELSSIMKSDCFTATNHDRSLEGFERRNPVMFAIDLSVFDENVSTESKRDAPEGPQLSKELNSFMQGMDDFDKGRLQKRVESHRRCAAPFLKYFSNSKRLVRLTLAGPVTNAVSTVRDLIRDFGFTMQRSLQRVVVFSLKEHFFNEIDTEYYKLRKIRLSDIVKTKKGDMVSQLKTVQQYIDRDGRQDENFAVVLDCLTLPDQKPIRRILFYEKCMSYLDEHIKIKAVGKVPFSRERVQVQMIASPDGNVLLFLDPFSDSIAKNIGTVFGEQNPVSTTTPSPET